MRWIIRLHAGITAVLAVNHSTAFTIDRNGRVARELPDVAQK
jgi:hypothetical protein